MIRELVLWTMQETVAGKYLSSDTAIINLSEEAEDDEEEEKDEDESFGESEH